MTLTEFAEKYYLHDSNIKKLEYDVESKTVTLTVGFCFWMQDWYQEGEPESGTITVIFHNVTKYSCDEGNPAAPLAGILDAQLRGDDIIFGIVDDETGVCFEMTIAAGSVEVIL